MLSANQGHRASVVRVREGVTVYEAVGGEPGAEERLRLFLMQYWGGPTTYSDERGHPRLRMRHNPYRVDLAARDAWLRCMITALEADPPAEPMRSAMIEYFVRSADFMRNTEEADEGV